MMVTKHKNIMEKLNEKDPEFVKFLKEQDANVDFEQFDSGSEGNSEEIEESDSSAKDNDDHINYSGSSSDSGEEPDTDNEKVVVNENEESKRLSKTKKKKKYKKTLEDAVYEDNDSEEEDESKNVETRRPLTIKKIKAWEKELSANKVSLDLIQNIASAFKSIAEKTGAKVDNVSYVIYGAKEFGETLNLCYEYFPKLWRKSSMQMNQQPSNNKVDSKKPLMRFKSKLLRPIIKEYFCDMIKFLPEIQDKDVLVATLVHLEAASDFVAMFPRKSRLLLKTLFNIWNSADNSHKTRAFDCIKSIVMRLKYELFIFAFKRMYLSYNKLNCLKASSINADGKVDFMQHSFADLCSIDTNSTYQNAFIYIRDLAIDLRKAILSMKEDDLKTVRSKHFINSLYLWSVVLNSLNNDENLKQLVYPLAQILIGCCKHITTNKYIPFRIHCIRCLLLLTKNTTLYVPTFALVTEILNSLITEKVTKGSKALTSKMITTSDLDNIVKLSKSQLEEQSYKTAVLEKSSDLIVEAIERQCCSPSFYETTFLLGIHLKRFCKEMSSKYNDDNKIAQSINNLKQVAMKVEEHSKWLEYQKATSDLNLNNEESLEEFERNMSLNVQNSMLKFSRSYKKLNERQRRVHFNCKNKIVKLTVNKEPKRKTKLSNNEDEEMAPKKVAKKQKLTIRRK